MIFVSQPISHPHVHAIRVFTLCCVHLFFFRVVFVPSLTINACIAVFSFRWRERSERKLRKKWETMKKIGKTATPNEPIGNWLTSA